MSSRTSILALAIGFLLAATPGYAASGRERSLAVYPRQDVPLKFSHAKHLEADMECTACHDPARKSTKSADNLLPIFDFKRLDAPEKAGAHPQCDDCHDIQAAVGGRPADPRSECKDCHAGFDRTVQRAPAPVRFPQANLIFDHKVHVAAHKIKCESCHGDMKGVDLATRQHLPKMETCLVCHDNTHASAACDVCHLTQPSGRLVQNFSQGSVTTPSRRDGLDINLNARNAIAGVLRPTQGNPFGIDHGPRYEFTHGTRASLDRGLCMECHAENDCQSCHDSLQKPLSVHPNDFITLHPVQARMDSTRCEACHRAQSFCAACHERVGLGMDADRSLRARNARVHPDYNTWVNVLGPGHHGVAASRDIKQCMSCHREESCMACHATAAVVPGSRAANPHPAGFRAACGGMRGRNDRACLKCHTAADLDDKGCR